MLMLSVLQKNAVFIGENDIFYLEKNEANW